MEVWKPCLDVGNTHGGFCAPLALYSPERGGLQPSGGGARVGTALPEAAKKGGRRPERDEEREREIERDR